MPDDPAANDDAVVTLDEALLLADEINQLRRELATTKRRLAELDRLAHRDSLVGLPNRRYFLTICERAIRAVCQHGGTAAVIFADVDGLKAINDQFGHAWGDKALLAVSRLLVASVRRDDCVARLGGDEFGILLEHSDELRAWQMGLRIVETFDHDVFVVDGQAVPLSVAIGVAIVRPDDTPEAVLARADKEMYRIKGVKPASSKA